MSGFEPLAFRSAFSARIQPALSEAEVPEEPSFDFAQDGSRAVLRLRLRALLIERVPPPPQAAVDPPEMLLFAAP